MTPVLLTDAERGGAEQAAILRLRGAPVVRGRILSDPVHRTPDLSALTFGAGGQMWIAGNINSYVDIVSQRHRDAYLARLDATGTPIWEKTYGDGGFRGITSIASMPPDDVAIVGSGWLARIAPDGSALWERPSRGVVVALLPENRLVVVGSGPWGDNYRPNVIAWIIDGASGDILAQTPIRELRRSNFNTISVVVGADAIYVTSNDRDLFQAQPIEVSKLRLDGTLLWSTLLPDTIKAVKTAAPTWRSCSPALAITPRGDAVVACPIETQIHLYQLDGSSGAYHESDLSLPDCHGGRSALLFLAVRDDRTMILSGSRPGYNTTASCSWVGRLRAIR